MMSVVVGRRSANRRGGGAARARLRGGHGGCRQGAAVEGSRLEGAAGGAVTLRQRGGGGLEDGGVHVNMADVRGEGGRTETKTHLCAAVPLSLSALAAAGEIFHQHGGEHAHHAVELPLPEAVVLVGLAAQDADDGAFRERQLIVRLSRVVVQRLGERHCGKRGHVKVRTRTR